MKDKAIIELIIVLALVAFGLWTLYKDKNSVIVPEGDVVNSQTVTPVQ